jgi:polyhydroxyalkanoate synthase
MGKSSQKPDSALAPKLAAPQHKPRPLPLFLELLRSETADDPARMARVLAGLRRYQEAERAEAPAAMPAVAQRFGAKLRDYGGGGKRPLHHEQVRAAPQPAAASGGRGGLLISHGPHRRRIEVRPGDEPAASILQRQGRIEAPVVFVPSLINPPSVLDLGPDKSLLRWLAGQGFRTLLVDWGWDLRARRGLSVAGHVEEVLLPLLDSLGAPAILVGYCLGGTMALAAAGLRPARGVALIAAPWHFSGFPEDARARLASLWGGARPTAHALGLLPMEALQSAFWALDPARTVAKFEAFAGFDPAGAEARRFVALEDWANDGPPLPEAAARELFDGFFAEDLPGRGEWRVGGAAARPADLACPILDIVSLSDRIVPAASATGLGERIETGAGHVGMMVGSKAEALLWRPLADWLSRVAAGC